MKLIILLLGLVKYKMYSKIDSYKNKYNCSLFIDKIYEILNINHCDKNIKIFNEDYIYLERETPKNIDNINILSVSYFYRNHERRVQYIEGVIESLKYMKEYFNDWYIFLHIDLSVLYLIINDNEVKDIFKILCSDKRVLLQFYYCSNGIIESNNKIIHNNTLGSYIRYLPFIINDYINCSISCEIEVLFTSYFHKLLYQDFVNDKKSEIFLFQSGWPLDEKLELTKYFTYNKQYIINGMLFIGSINGYKKIDINNSIMPLYKNIYRKFILNDIKDIVHKHNHNYEYGIDEIYLLYSYNQVYKMNNNMHNDHIKIYGVSNHKDYYVISSNLSEVFNYMYGIGENSHRIIDVSILRVYLIMYFYNKEHIIKNNDLYNGYKVIFDNLNLDINNINNYIDKVQNIDLFKMLYDKLHYKDYETFINQVINHNHYYIIGHKKYMNVKLINLYY